MRSFLIAATLLCAAAAFSQISPDPLAVVTAYSQQAPVLSFPPPAEGVSLLYHPPSKALLLIGGIAVIPPIQAEVMYGNGMEENGLKPKPLGQGPGIFRKALL